jgi:hypothetical protein
VRTGCGRRRASGGGDDDFLHRVVPRSASPRARPVADDSEGMRSPPAGAPRRGSWAGDPEGGGAVGGPKVAVKEATQTRADGDPISDLGLLYVGDSLSLPSGNKRSRQGCVLLWRLHWRRPFSILPFAHRGI